MSLSALRFRPSYSAEEIDIESDIDGRSGSPTKPVQ